MKANLLKSEMAACEVSVDDLINAIGISKPTWYRRINDPQGFNAYEIKKICEKLHITDLKKQAEIFLS